MSTSSRSFPAGLGIESVQPLLAHFDAQEAALLALKSLLTDIGRSTGETENTRDLMARMAAASELLTRLQQDINVILQDLTEALAVPAEEFSIRTLIRHFDRVDRPTAEALRGSRSRLLRLRWQTGRIAAGSGWIISEQRRFCHTILQCAAGASDSDRYDSSGRMAITPDAMKFRTRS